MRLVLVSVFTSLYLLYVGIVGEIGDTSTGHDYYIWTRKKLEIGYHGNQVSATCGTVKPVLNGHARATS